MHATPQSDGTMQGGEVKQVFLLHAAVFQSNHLTYLLFVQKVLLP